MTDRRGTVDRRSGDIRRVNHALRTEMHEQIEMVVAKLSGKEGPAASDTWVHRLHAAQVIRILRGFEPRPKRMVQKQLAPEQEIHPMGLI